MLLVPVITKELAPGQTGASADVGVVVPLGAVNHDAVQVSVKVSALIAAPVGLVMAKRMIACRLPIGAPVLSSIAALVNDLTIAGSPTVNIAVAPAELDPPLVEAAGLVVLV